MPKQLKKEYEIAVSDGKFHWGDRKSVVDNVNLNVKKVIETCC